MLVLGIETSCDETAAAVVSDAVAPAERIRSSVVLSQIAEHTPYEGVVPEVAARAHLANIDAIVKRRSTMRTSVSRISTQWRQPAGPV